MKFFSIFYALSVLLAPTGFAMKKEEFADKRYYDPTSQGGMLPRELHNELVKFITNNYTDTAYEHWEKFKKPEIFINENIINFAVDEKRKRIIAGMGNGTIKVFNMTTKECEQIVENADFNLGSIFCFDIETNKFFFTSKATIQEWDLNNNTCNPIITDCARAYYTECLLYDNVYKRLIWTETKTYNSEFATILKIFNISKNNYEKAIPLKNKVIRALAFGQSTDDLFVAGETYERDMKGQAEVSLYNLQMYTFIKKKEIPARTVHDCAFDHKHNRLFITGADGHIWNLNLDTLGKFLDIEMLPYWRFNKIQYDPNLNCLYLASLKDCFMFDCSTSKYKTYKSKGNVTCSHSDFKNNKIYFNQYHRPLYYYTLLQDTITVDKALVLHKAFECLAKNSQYDRLVGNNILNLNTDNRWSTAFKELPTEIQDAIVKNIKVTLHDPSKKSEHWLSLWAKVMCENKLF